MAALPGQKAGLNGTYNVRSLPRGRLTWPELTRRHVEQDSASEPSLDERWITYRYVLRKNSLQLYMDDRLVGERRDPKLDTTGFFRLRLNNNMQLASLTIHEPTSEEPRLEMVAMTGYLNSGTFQGQTLKREGLPVTVNVGNIKFVLPAASMPRDAITSISMIRGCLAAWSKALTTAWKGTQALAAVP